MKQGLVKIGEVYLAGDVSVVRVTHKLLCHGNGRRAVTKFRLEWVTHKFVPECKMWDTWEAPARYLRELTPGERKGLMARGVEL